MYAKIENGAAVEYPLYEGDLERRFPELKFPLDDSKNIEANGGYVIPEGYAVVYQNPVVDYDYTKKYEMGMPTLDAADNKWKETWVAIPLTVEELEVSKNTVGNNVRKKRNELLQKSDVFVVADRWANYITQEQTEWATYRQSLRDITLQVGYPYSVEWPVSPALFTIRAI